VSLAKEVRTAENARKDRERVNRLREILRRARRGGRLGLGRLDADELAALPRLYRFASSLYARLESDQSDAAAAAKLRPLILKAHELLYRDLDRTNRPLVKRLAEFLFATSPRAIRAEWRLLTGSAAFFYGISLLAGWLVSRDLALAYTLFDSNTVDAEISQLIATADGAPFRGNFTFGLGESPGTAGWIMAHNMGVCVLFFGAALLPPLYLYVLASNGLMLGTYIAVAGHWDQAGAISSILWCHGVLELQAIILAGTAGLILVRAWVAPGPWSRREAMARESRRAWALLAPTFPLLFCAGLIEGFISPLAPHPVRVLVAVSSAVALVVWVTLGGRPARRPAPAPPTPPAGR
jgi:uncharacterized membrane protein SpoIIM required for sporulation